MLFSVMLAAIWTLLLLQAPTPTDVGQEASALVVVGLGALGSAMEQMVKKAVAPFDNASPLVKSMVTLVWGFGLAWLAGRVPWLAAQLPASPSGLGVATNGILMTLTMMGLHKIKQVVAPPPVT